MVEDVCVQAKYFPRHHPLQLSDRCQTTQNPSEFDTVLESGPIQHGNGNLEKQHDANLVPHLDGKQQIFGVLYQTQV